MSQLNALYEKITHFEAQLEEDFTKQLQCKKGCDHCCYVDLSVFPIEAENIKSWLHSQPAHIKKEIDKARGLKQSAQKGFDGKHYDPCTFLRNGSCLIYAARPLICRTQGLALMFKDHDNESFVDICPLNQEALTELKHKNILNTEIINTILAQLNQLAGHKNERVFLKDIL